MQQQGTTTADHRTGATAAARRRRPVAAARRGERRRRSSRKIYGSNERTWVLKNLWDENTIWRPLMEFLSSPCCISLLLCRSVHPTRQSETIRSCSLEWIKLMENQQKSLFSGVFKGKFSLKVRQSRNVFFKPTILPKNERTNSFFLPNSTMIELFRSFFGRIRG